MFYKDSSGVMLPAELAWLPKFANGALPGSYKFGAWYSSATQPDVVLDINGNQAAFTNQPPLKHRGLYGSYINFLQQLTRNASENPNGGLSAFLNAVMADKRTSFTDRQIAAGIMYTAPFSWRPNDNIAFAWGTTHVNNRVATVETLQKTMDRCRFSVPSTSTSCSTPTFRRRGSISGRTCRSCSIPAGPA